MGNLLSVRRGLEHCGAEVIQSSDPKVILASEKIILPGVGAFPIAMGLLSKLNLISVIQELGELETPLLGICLGMQLLMDESEEFGVTAEISHVVQSALFGNLLAPVERFGLPSEPTPSSPFLAIAHYENLDRALLQLNSSFDFQFLI